ncbi:protein of unknown function [Gordonia malaquae]|uniref:DUF1877 family protein n=1 Tax=Gordonia malaquae NBRC 108250 TaxID=1223542 RepID=M3TCC9_GORML|nr:DUF1877 family protein [Gordonia malaquae]GAC79086.1 hypothetical protein GM1_007_00450 [Gordonia malaquae NBRC 108250]SEE10807.1 protein of unknown function [Gordonia malaquae]
MGIVASYVMLDDGALDRLLAGPESDGWDDFEYGDDEMEDLDKFWDALHVALTGVTTLDANDGDPLSQAILGVRELDEDNESEFVAVIGKGDVPRILAALRSVDIDGTIAHLNPSEKVREATYPDGIWDLGLEGVLPKVFGLLVAFYERAAAAGANVAIGME